MEASLATSRVSKPYYTPFNPGILDFPTEIKLNTRDGPDAHLPNSIPVPVGPKVDASTSKSPTPQLKSGYKPFNPALLSDFAQLGIESLEERGGGHLIKSRAQPDHPDSQDTNPFRRARLNIDLPTTGTADDGTLEIFSLARPFEATPKRRFAAALTTRDAIARHDTSLRGGSIPKPRAEVDPEDYGFLTSSFGKRYTKSSQAEDAAVSHVSVHAEDDGNRECAICAETKLLLDFPTKPITATCDHPPAACLECVRMSIKTDLDTKIWTEIRCPECPMALDYVDIRDYADAETFSRFDELTLRAAMSQADNFIWCTAGCGSGQIHESTARHPIVTCLHCGQRSCFQHSVPWHQGLTCKEYDRLLADPENFKSRWENDDKSEIRQRHQVDADRAVARGLVAGEETARRRRHFKRRQVDDRKRVEEEAAARARDIAIKRKREEERTEKTIGRTTKPCPECGSSIEKKGGCSHMTCTKCKYEFCWKCGASHRDIVEGDNSFHRRTCRYHPDNAN